MRPSHEQPQLKTNYVGVDSDTYWATLDPILEERSRSPEDHMHSETIRLGSVLGLIPNHIFNPKGIFASPARKTWKEMRKIVRGKKQTTPQEAREVFWRLRNEVAEALDFAGMD